MRAIVEITEVHANGKRVVSKVLEEPRLLICYLADNHETEEEQDTLTLTQEEVVKIYNIADEVLDFISERGEDSYAEIEAFCGEVLPSHNDEYGDEYVAEVAELFSVMDEILHTTKKVCDYEFKLTLN